MNPVNKKLTEDDCQRIIKLIGEGHMLKDIAKQFNVHPSTIQKRCKGRYELRTIPLEIKNKVFQAIKEGHTKAEAAEMLELNIGTVYCMTKGIKGYIYQGSHVLRKGSIILMNRLLLDGCLITDFCQPTARNLQRHFPSILTARYRAKTFFYLKGREEETIEMFFKQMPGHVIHFAALEEISFLLSVKINRENQGKLIEKYKGQHRQFEISKRLQQRRIEDFFSDDEYEFTWEEPKFHVPPKQED